VTGEQGKGGVTKLGWPPIEPRLSRAKNMAEPINVCLGCGRAFDPSVSSTGAKRGNLRKYCTLKCRNKVYHEKYAKPKACRVCGGQFVPVHHSTAVCGAACREIERQSAEATKLLACVGCGTMFKKRHDRHGYNRYCSRQCFFTRGKQQPTVKGDSRRVAPAVRAFVLFRDGNKCQCCRKTLRHDVNDKHPDKANIDHVIPRSRGGSHESVNLQALCRTCNAKKADRRLNLF
jgi:5-methylcytosine-specific restriction endonuclease McrA